MKIKDILNYLNTDYLLVSDDSNEYVVEYLHKNEVSDSILNSNLYQIEPVMAIKKSIFDENASDSDFVSALKIITTNRVVEEPIEDVYEEQTQTTWNTNPKSQPREEEPTYRSPFGQGGFDPFGGLDTSFLTELITPEMIEQFTQSDIFQEMMKPENIKKTMESEQFKHFTENVDLGDIFGSMNSIFSHPSSNQSDETRPTYEEYEEFDDFDEPVDDEEDEYEEI